MTAAPAGTSGGAPRPSAGPRGVAPFVHRLLTISTVQICREAGYDQSQSSALDALTSLLHLYIRQVGLTAKAYAELANRQRVNLLDTLAALDDYQQGIELLMDYRAHSDNLPFYHPVPPFPVPRRLLKVQPSTSSPFYTPQFVALNPHIPPFLPAFPDEYTYQATPVKPDVVAGDLRKRKLEQSRAVGPSLTLLTALERQRQRDDRSAEGDDDDAKRVKREPPTAAADAQPSPSPSSPTSAPSTHAPAGRTSAPPLRCGQLQGEGAGEGAGQEPLHGTSPRPWPPSPTISSSSPLLCCWGGSVGGVDVGLTKSCGQGGGSAGGRGGWGGRVRCCFRLVSRWG